jgi:tRNA threonylcarbamoyladenosine biosynthesis protein TsaB
LNCLALETATTACAVGLSTESVELVRVLDHDRRHTEVLALGIASMLEETALGARDIDRVVVDVGPGLFTGLRVGIATAIGLSQGLGCALVGVTSLELLAHGAHDAGVRGSALCCVDGRRGEIFVQTFSLGNGVESLDAPSVAVASDVVSHWATYGTPVTFTGDGVERYLTDFTAVPGAQFFSQTIPSVHAALALGSLREATDTVAPLYLREADAIANFTTRERS